MILDEHNFGGATAQGFNPDGACSGKQIDESGAGDVGSQHVEQRFAQAIACGSQRKALEAFQDAAAVGSGDDAHGCGY